MRWRQALLAAALAASGQQGSACTYVEVPFGPSVVIGRTMELGGRFMENLWHVVAVPRGWEFSYDVLPQMPGTHGEGLSREMLAGRPGFASKDGIVGISGRVSVAGLEVAEVMVDGMNEAGLSASAHTHREAVYQQHTEAARKAEEHVQFLAFVPWVLARFASVKEAREALLSGRVAIVAPGYTPKGLNIHFAVSDAQGGSIVVECVGGQLKVHDNPVGVFTNDPPFDWHLMNLNQYTQVGPTNPDRSRDIGVVDTEVGPVPSAMSHGLNLVGLPGDMGPPARFVRTFFLKELALYGKAPSTEAEAIVLATNLVNSVAIPFGSLAKTSATDPGDYTQWAVIKSPASGRLLFRTHSNNAWRAVSMGSLGKFFKEGQGRKNMAMFDDSTGITDVTSDLL